MGLDTDTVRSMELAAVLEGQLPELLLEGPPVV
ncbi:hypothetical protein GGP99_001649 [Salinibacter ruber]|uniref:Uncharacterized protein n=1 Tax=Salinibacter ruber TaxID=146919 RepID=A0AAW5P706_9BACT|nr:hypothetical protein [Salinibacter ruber]